MSIEIPLSGIEAAFAANAGQIEVASGFLGILFGMTFMGIGASDDRNATAGLFGMCIFIASLFVFGWGLTDSGILVVT